MAGVPTLCGLPVYTMLEVSNVREPLFVTAFGREPLLAALKLAAVEGPLCGQDRTVAFFHDV